MNEYPDLESIPFAVEGEYEPPLAPDPDLLPFGLSPMQFALAAGSFVSLALVLTGAVIWWKTKVR